MELKPCPFCGGHPELGHTRNATYIYCTECNAQAGYNNNYDSDAEREDAVTVWNARADV